MRRLPKRWIATLMIGGLVVLGPWLLWVTLNHRPQFYAEWESMPAEVLKVQANRFTASSLQLRNDIVNEPAWEASFTDTEVNAWLSENLLSHFSDQLPPEISDPRVEFEQDHVTLAFKYKRGAITSIIWAIAKIDVPENNTIAVTIEKLRAGVVPINPEDVLDHLTKYAIARGVHVTWDDHLGYRRAIIRYRTSLERNDVMLKQVRFEKGRLRVSGTSSPTQTAILPPTLPNREVLQTAFPKHPRQASSSTEPSHEDDLLPPLEPLDETGDFRSSNLPATNPPSN